MRIISKFRDYYDSVQSHGFNDGLVYLRHTSDFVLDRNARFPSKDPMALRVWAKHFLPIDAFVRSVIPSNIQIDRPSQDKSFRRLEIKFAAALFAGKIYTLAHIIRNHPSNPYQTAAEQNSFAYSLDGVQQALLDHGSSVEKIGLNKSYSWRAFEEGLPAERIRESRAVALENWFSISGSDQLSGLCTEHGLACAMWQQPNFTINPKLADIEFFRCLPHAQAFQELSMFLGNIASPDLVPVTLEEKYRVQQHGFDPQYGFRKRPK